MPFESLSTLLYTWSVARPSHPALCCGSETVNYAELASRSYRISHALRSEGVGQGSRVAYYGRISIAFFEVLFGAHEIGAVLVPLNWRLAPREIETVLADSATELAIADPEFSESLDLMAENLPSLRRIIYTKAHSGNREYISWRDTYSPLSSHEEHRGSRITLQIYTSGTTGTPKGVLSDTQALMAYLEELGDIARFSSASVSLCTLPLFHIGGIGWVLAGLNRGATTVLLCDTGADQIIEAAETNGASILFAVPSMIRTILDAPSLVNADLRELTTLYYGGGPVTQQVLNEALSALNCDFVQGFGLTECPLVTALPPEDHTVELLSSCGKAIPGTEIRLVDPSTGTDVPTGSVGELWVRSSLTMAGYWRQPEATATALVEGGWLRTGDAAKMDQDGHIFMADRMKDMIVTGGENVYPAEIENTLTRHPAVADCAVFGAASRRWTEAVTAAVVLRPSCAATGDELREYCRGFLAGYKCPKSVIFVDELPRTPSGKVLKYRLKQEYGDCIE